MAQTHVALFICDFCSNNEQITYDPLLFTIRILLSFVSASISSISMGSGWRSMLLGSMMHMLKPAMMTLIENTMSGVTVPKSDRDPIEDAESRHMRPKIVHEIISRGRRFGWMSSTVLDVIVTSVMLTDSFRIKLKAITTFGWLCTVSNYGQKKPKYTNQNGRLSLVFNLLTSRTLVSRDSRQQYVEADENVEQSGKKPLSVLSDHKDVGDRNAEQFSDTCFSRKKYAF